MITRYPARRIIEDLCGARLLQPLKNLIALGERDAGSSAAIVASLLPEWQTGIDLAGCSATAAGRGGLADFFGLRLGEDDGSALWDHAMYAVAKVPQST